MKWTKYFLVAVFLIGAGIRLVDAFRPINRPSWRECDEGSIARNFALEETNLFYPRIDWRGSTPGYAEMEFPHYPFAIAILYKIFGVHDWFGRFISFLFSMATIFLFWKLAREFLEEFASLVAVGFFTFNPLLVELSTSIQPEGVMFFFYVASVYFFRRWLVDNTWKNFLFAALMTAFALLSKMTAAHIGLLFAVFLIDKQRASAFLRKENFVFAAIAVLPAFGWYLHAKGFWTTYGNSLGVSNESHLVGWDFLTNSYFIEGILNSEVNAIWLKGGLAFGFVAVLLEFRKPAVRFCLIWFAAIFAFYILAARTTADDWATYYHIFSLAPASILVGVGVMKVLEVLQRTSGASRAILGLVAGGLTATVLLTQAIGIRAEILQRRVADQDFLCAKTFKPQLKKEGLILASGWSCLDDDGLPVAYNESFYFYWLDRKGFNICIEEQSIPKIREFVGRGAKYFVAGKNKLEKKPGFETALRENFPVVAECDSAIVFDIEVSL